MTSANRRPIELFVETLDAWTIEAFPPPRQNHAAALNATWRMFARALAGSQAGHVTDAPLGAFHHELREKRKTPEAGMPPRRAIEDRMRAIVAVGMDEMYLAVCLRQSMDNLIAVQYPQALTVWRRLADEFLRTEWQWSFWNLDEPPSQPHSFLQGKPFSQE